MGKTSRIRSFPDPWDHLAHFLNAIHVLSTLLGFLPICWESKHLEKSVPFRTKGTALKVDCKWAWESREAKIAQPLWVSEGSQWRRHLNGVFFLLRCNWPIALCSFYVYNIVQHNELINVLLWDNYHNKFREHSSPFSDNFFLVGRAFKWLLNIQYSIINCGHHAVHYIPLTYFVTRSLYFLSLPLPISPNLCLWQPPTCSMYLCIQVFLSFYLFSFRI